MTALTFRYKEGFLERGSNISGLTLSPLFIKMIEELMSVLFNILYMKRTVSDENVMPL